MAPPYARLEDRYRRPPSRLTPGSGIYSPRNCTERVEHRTSAGARQVRREERVSWRRQRSGSVSWAPGKKRQKSCTALRGWTTKMPGKNPGARILRYRRFRRPLTAVSPASFFATASHLAFSLVSPKVGETAPTLKLLAETPAHHHRAHVVRRLSRRECELLLSPQPVSSNSP